MSIVHEHGTIPGMRCCFAIPKLRLRPVRGVHSGDQAAHPQQAHCTQSEGVVHSSSRTSLTPMPRHDTSVFACQCAISGRVVPLVASLASDCTPPASTLHPERGRCSFELRNQCKSVSTSTYLCIWRANMQSRTQWCPWWQAWHQTAPPQQAHCTQG